MIRIRPSFIAPLASIMILVLGAGFYTTLTTLDMTERDVDKWIIGCVSCSFFVGLLISAFRTQHFIARVGHIRAFAAFASVMAVVTLLQGVYFSPTLWVVLRFIAGYALAGIAIVVESWLLDASDKRDRGSILAIYMLAYYLAQAMSQLFLTIDIAKEIEQYTLIAIFIALSILPVSMTRFQVPMPNQPTLLPLEFLFKRVPLGVIGCFIGGLILGPLYTLLPDYLRENTKTDSEVGLIMMSLILGGTFLQYPIGRLSDRLDRRRVLLAISVASVITFILFIPNFYSTLWLVILAFLMGGTTFTIYPLSSSHTIDHIKPSNMISAISTMLLAYGSGSAIGPLISPIFTKLLGNNGLCYYLLMVGLILCIYTALQITRNVKYIYEEHVDFVGLPRTTPTAVPEPTEEVKKTDN